MILPLFFSMVAPIQDPTEDQVSLAKQAMEDLAEANRTVRAIEARYEQERHTKLLEMPLVTSGRFLHRSDPGCLVFKTREPREGIIRLDAEAYTVYRPAKSRAEVFEFKSNQLAKVLLLMFRPRLDEIERRFRIVSVQRQEGAVRVELVPTSKKELTQVKEVGLVIRLEKPALLEVSYRDSQSDRTIIRFKSIQAFNKMPDADFLDELPEGTRVIRHQIQLESETSS